MKNKEAESQSHQEIKDLLPWYANETLPVAERELLAAHLSECSACFAELETLQVLRSVVKASNERLPYPSEGQLDALIARIEKSEPDRPRQQIRALGARFNEWWVSLPALAKSAMIAQAVAVLVLAGTSVMLGRRAGRWEAVATQIRQRATFNEGLLAGETQRETEYRALSGPQADGGSAAIKIVVLFRENAEEQEIRALLLSISAQFVSGPSPARFYVLRLVTPPDADAQSLMNDALAQLRRRDDLVEFAEPQP